MENTNKRRANPSAVLQKKVKRLTAAVIALCVAVIALGAGAAVLAVQNGKLRAVLAQNGTASADVPNAAAVTAKDAVVAEFDGGTVTAAEAAEEYEMLTTYYRLLGIDEADYAEDAKQEVIDGLIEDKLLTKKAQEMGCYELSQEQQAALEVRVRQEYEDEIEYYKEFRFDESKTEEQIRQETIEYLNENGLSYEEMLAQAKKDAWRDNLYEAVTKDLTIDEAQLKEFYDTQVASDELTYSASFIEYEMDADAGRAIVWHPEGVRRIDTILIPFNDEQMAQYIEYQSEMEEGTADHLDELDALYTQLEPVAQAAADRLKAGERFEDLQAEYGMLSESGVYVGAESQLYGDAFRDAAMGLAKVGDISAPVNTDMGICILRYAGDVTPGQVEFESIKDALRENYEQEIKSSRYNETVMQWFADANVVYHLENF